MTPIIRRAHLTDLPYAYDICLRTAASGSDAAALFSDPYLVGQYYAAPYIVRDPGLCFIAEEDRVPKGYAVAAENTVAYETWLESEWLPPLRERYPLALLESPPAETLSQNERGLIRSVNAPHPDPSRANAPWMPDYPAHLHIDLLPALQGKGCGRLLMERLFSALAERGCPGVHLGVDGTNVNAIGFYGKLGFDKLEERDWGLILGRAL